MPLEPDEPTAGSDVPADSRDGRPGPDPAEYWRRNLRHLAVLLTIWFAVSFGAGILFAERLDELRIPGTGFPVGFWFAQQGSIYTFVILIFVYVVLMNRLDREFDVDEEDAGAAAKPKWRARADKGRAP